MTDPSAAGSLSLVVPAYNERDNLETLVAEIEQVMAMLGRPWELLLVDDGGDDGGPELMDTLAATRPPVRALHMVVRGGQSAALLAGFAGARGDTIITLDADLQNDPADIPRLLQALPGHGVVVGIRSRRRDPWLRRVSSRLANGCRNLMTRDGVEDTGCSLKVFRREALSDLPRVRGVHRFLPTLAKMRGHQVAQIPVSHRPRQAGKSKYGIGNRLFVGLGDLLMIRWMQMRAVSSQVARESGSGLPVSGEKEEHP